MRQVSSVSLLVFGLFGCLGAANSPQTRLAEVEDLQPLGYRAELTLDPDATSFSGIIEIHLTLRKPVSTLWLNQKNLEIQSATLTNGGLERNARTIPAAGEFIGLQVDGPLAAGPLVAKLHYTGKVNDKNLSGIFLRRDLGHAYLYTQFEATDARAAFPCLDEPFYKTTWQLTLHIPKNDTAVSNTPPASEMIAGGVKTITFKETKPLPSYLVALGVGPFEYVPGGTAGRNRAPVRIVVPKGRVPEARYAAEVTATILTRLENYFGIPYPYDKADQVAIPNANIFGAMENPGMVTYEADLILADPKTDRIFRQRQFASVAAHELAHQWFGDLVTTAWWDDIWLNEAFATWMERKLIAEWKPEWQTVVSDVSNKLHAEEDDSLVSARKIRQEILSNDDINNAFDSITYEKGASVIGMFEQWMGPEDFRKGVQGYLKQYSFQATTAGQFLDSLSSSSRRNVGEPFSTFLNQAGVPLVSVSLECASGTATLHLKQQRFLPAGSRGSAQQSWNIPLCVRFGPGAEAQRQCTLLNAPSQDMVLTNAKSCPLWVEANDGALGYYRVSYEGALLQALTSGDVAARLSPAERTDLMGNASALTNANRLTAAEALALVETFHADPEWQVQKAAIDMALAPLNSLVPSALMPNYQRFLLKNFDAKARELGWSPKPGESPDTGLLRPSLLRPVATWGGDTVLASQARDLTEHWLVNHQGIDPNVLNAVLATAAFNGDKALFDRFLSEFKSTQNPQLRASLIAAMGAFRDPAAIGAAMKTLLTGDISFLEGARLFFAGQQTEATRSMSFDFLRTNYDQIVAKMPTGGGFDFGAVFPQVGRSYCDGASRDRLRTFLEPNTSKFVGAPRELAQTLEAIDLCIAQKAVQGPSVEAFLSKY